MQRHAFHSGASSILDPAECCNMPRVVMWAPDTSNKTFRANPSVNRKRELGSRASRCRTNELALPSMYLLDVDGRTTQWTAHGGGG
jgi:hypothetical protein